MTIEPCAGVQHRRGWDYAPGLPQKESPTPLARGAIKVALKSWMRPWMDGRALGQPFSRLKLSCDCHIKAGFYRFFQFLSFPNLLLSL